MKIVDFAYPNVLPCEEDIVLCLGYFDGVHLGHQKLIQESKKEGYKVAVFSFDNSPGFVLGKIAENSSLTSPSDRAEYFSELGVDYFYLMHFDKEVARLSKDDFIKKIINVINPKKIFVGEDYRFGYLGSGDPTYLRKFFNVKVVGYALINEKKISSKDIVTYIKEGNLEQANTLLSRPYRIAGLVVKGLQNGTKIATPTANLKLSFPYVFPHKGVYAGFVDLYGKSYMASINIGIHPTISVLDKPIIEVHLLDYSGDLYGKEILVSLVKYIRPEMKFETLNELASQIQKDEIIIKSTLLNSK